MRWVNNILFVLIVTVTTTTTTTVYAQPNFFKNEFEEYNKEYNEYVYLYRSCWTYLANNLVTHVKIYTENESFYIKYAKTSVDREAYFKIIMRYTIDSTVSQTTKIVFSTINNTKKTFDIANCDVKYHTNEKLDRFAYMHLKYMYKTKHFDHTQFGKNTNQRRKDVGLSFEGTFGENLSRHRSYKLPETRTERIQLALGSYYTERYNSSHWEGIIDMNYKYFTSYFLEGFRVLYSLTTMTTGEIFDIK